jgi:hypothetical protein
VTAEPPPDQTIAELERALTILRTDPETVTIETRRHALIHLSVARLHLMSPTSVRILGGCECEPRRPAVE